MAQVVDKKVKIQLVGLNSNAFALMGAFQGAAKKQGWSREEVDLVLNECKKGDYDDLLNCLMEHTESPDEEDEDNGRRR